MVSRIYVRLDRMRAGNPGDVKPVGEGVYELRIDYGPGYRVYFAKQGEIVILLLLGGDKSTQSKDIREAIICWQDHKRRLSEGAKEGKQ